MLLESRFIRNVVLVLVPQMRVWGCFVTRSYNWSAGEDISVSLIFINKETQKTKKYFEKVKTVWFPQICLNLQPKAGKCKLARVEDCRGLAGLCLCLYIPLYVWERDRETESGKCWCFCISFYLSVLWSDQTLHCISVRYFSERLFSIFFKVETELTEAVELLRLAIPADSSPVCLRLKAAGISPLAFAEDWRRQQQQ